MTVGMFFLTASSVQFTAAFAADNQPVQVKADHVEYFDTTQKVVASGSVTAVSKDTKLTCDEATIYMATKDAYLKGDVRIAQAGVLLKGEEILYNFETRKGVILKAEVETGPFRASGDRAHKVADSEFTYRGGYLTTCDFETPHSRVQATEIKIFLDDKVVLKNAVMYVGNLPVFYTPAYVYPLDDKRPRVTIIPGKSKEWGMFVLTSWRLYFSENLSGRFFYDARERLGLAQGLELKYRLPVGGNGIFRTYYTDEDKIQQKHLLDRYIHPEKGAHTDRLNRERFQLRHTADIDPVTKATLEIHQMRDPATVKDFFPTEYLADPSPQTYFQIIRATPLYGLTFLVTRRTNIFQTVSQSWPSLNVQIRPVALPWLPGIESIRHWLAAGKATNRSQPTSQSGWYYESNYSYAHTNVSDRTGLSNSYITGGIKQQLSYVTKLFGWLNVRPFGEFQEALFSRSAVSNNPITRQSAATGGELSTRFFRVFPIESKVLGLDIHSIRHIINPLVQYRYQSNPTVPVKQLFNGGDGLVKTNTLTPSIEQKLQTKHLIDGKWQAVDRARFLTQMPYDLEGPSGQGGRWNNVDMDLEIKPYSWLYAEADGHINPHIGKFETINADLFATGGHSSGVPSSGSQIDRRSGFSYSRDAEGFRDAPWGAGLGWRYQRHTSAQLTFETEFDLDPKWRIGIYQAVDVKRFSTEQTTLGEVTTKKIYDVPDQSFRLRRDLHEWTAELMYNSIRGQGNAILLLFRLKDFQDLPVDFGRHYNLPKAGKNFPKLGNTPPPSSPSNI